MGILKRKKKVPAAIGTKGQPVYVNPPANTSSRMRRNLKRIAKCEFYMGILEPGTELYESWKREHTRRKLWLEANKERN